MESPRSAIHRTGRISLFLLVAVFGIAAALAPPVSAQNIKLGTLVPRGTSHHQSLLKMGQNWKQESGGKVKLVIYPDGIVGSEAAMIKRMRIGQIQSALVTAVGLTEIDKAASSLSFFPFTFRSLEELTYVRENLQPLLAERLRSKGFEVLFWADSGWVRFFSRKRVVYPNDLRSQNVFAWAGDGSSADLLRKMDFKPVLLEADQIYHSLQSGTIDAVAMHPFHALASQTYTFAPHAMKRNYVPMIGACVITKEAWDKFPADLQERLKARAGEIGKVITESGRRENEESIASMQEKWGLQVHDIPPEADKEWNAIAETARADVRGKIVPEEIFDRVMELLDEYRARN